MNYQLNTKGTTVADPGGWVQRSELKGGRNASGAVGWPPIPHRYFNFQENHHFLETLSYHELIVSSPNAPALWIPIDAMQRDTSRRGFTWLGSKKGTLSTEATDTDNIAYTKRTWFSKSNRPCYNASRIVDQSKEFQPA